VSGMWGVWVAAGVAGHSDHRQCLQLRQDAASHDVISEYYATH